MTLDKTPPTESNSSNPDVPTDTDAPTRKPARRRATRPVAATTAQSTEQSAAPAASTTTPVRSAAQTVDVLAELQTAAVPVAKAPKRRASAPHEAEIAALDVVASIAALELGDRAVAPKTPRRSRAKEATDPNVPVLFDEAPVPAKKRVAKRAAAAPAGTEPTVTEPTAEIAAPAAADTTEPVRKTRSRRSVKAAEVVETPAGTIIAEQVEPVTAPREVRSGSRRAARAAGANSAPASQVGAPAQVMNLASAATEAVSETATETKSEPAEAPVAPKATRAPRRATRAPAEAPVAIRPFSEPVAQPAAPAAEIATSELTAEEAIDAAPAPRRATTALLFQAPDPEAARPRRRRAQTPAGPPQAITELIEQVSVDDDAKDADETAETPEAGATVVIGRRAKRDSAVATDEGSEESAAAEASAEDLDDASDDESGGARRRRRRGGRGRRNRGGSDNQDDSDESEEDGSEESDSADANDEDDRQPRGRRRSRSSARASATEDPDSAEEAVDVESGDDQDDSDEAGSSRRRRRRRSRGTRAADGEPSSTTQSAGRSTASSRGRTAADEVTALKGSTRLEAKRQRRREGRDAGRRRATITEAEFLARRESVERSMIVRERAGRTQIAVLEDGVLVEHYVSQQSQASMAGNVYLGRVQNVLPSMEAAFIDVGKGRNAVLYAGEVNWDAHGLDGQPRRIEQALKSGDSVLVQVTKDPIGQKGARLTSQVTLAGRYLVYVPGGGMTGISRKLPDNERARLKKILREIVPEPAGVIVRTAAEGASEDELRADIARLQEQWTAIEKKAKGASAPALLQGEPDLAIRVVRDIFNDDFTSLTVSGDDAWAEISTYVNALAPDLAARVSRWVSERDVFAEARIDEQLAKGMDRKVWLPSGGSLVIDRTEAMTVVDVNTGKFTGSGGTLEETVTRNNLEAAEEIVRQLRLRDIGGIIVIDFIDMVLESNRDLVLRRLVECLGRDRTKHQVAEVTSLGLVQMTRKRVGQGLVEAFSETCDRCNGRGFIVHDEPNEKHFQGGSQPSEAQAAAASAPAAPTDGESKRSRRKRGSGKEVVDRPAVPVLPEARDAVKATIATIAAAAAHAHDVPAVAESTTPAVEVNRQDTPADPQRGQRAVFDVVAELRAVQREHIEPITPQEVSVEDLFPGPSGRVAADSQAGARADSADNQDAGTTPEPVAAPDEEA